MTRIHFCICSGVAVLNPHAFLLIICQDCLRLILSVKALFYDLLQFLLIHLSGRAGYKISSVLGCLSALYKFSRIPRVIQISKDLMKSLPPLLPAGTIPVQLLPQADSVRSYPPEDVWHLKLCSLQITFCQNPCTVSSSESPQPIHYWASSPFV